LNPLTLGISPIFTIQGTHSTYKKVGSVVKPAGRQAVEALYFVSSFVVADSFQLRSRQLLVAPKRYALSLKDDSVNNKRARKWDNSTAKNIGRPSTRQKN
jgi:hypothetical protein